MQKASAIDTVAGAPASAGQKILVVEDDVQIRTMLERFLTGKGYRVITAGDGLEGIRAFSSERPALVVVDLLLPKLLGSDVCDMIKRSVEGSSVPVVMLSAFIQEKNLDHDLRGKIRPEAFLVKPFQFAELLRIVTALLEGKGEEERRPPLEVLEIVDDGQGGVFPLSEVGFGAETEPAPAAAPPSAPSPAPSPAEPPEPVPERPPWEPPAAAEPPEPVPERPPWEPPAAAPPPGRSAPRGPPRVRAWTVSPEVAGAAGGSEFDDFLRDLRSSLSDEEVDRLSLPVEGLQAPGEAPAPSPPAVSTTLASPVAPSPVAPSPDAPAPAVERLEPGPGIMRPRVPATGLAAMPFADLLCLLYRRIFSGVLSLEREGGRKEIFFLNGFPVHVTSSFRGDSLGRSLVRMGRIDEEAYLRWLEAIEERQCDPAEALAELGLVASHELPAMVRALQRENLLRCFTWGDAEYELRQGAEHVARVPAFEMNPVVLVAEGLVATAVPTSLAEELRPQAERFVAATPDYARYYPQIAHLLPVGDLGPLLDGTRRLVEVVEAVGGDWAAPLTAVKVFVTLGMIEFRDAVRPAVPAPAEPVAEWPVEVAALQPALDPEFEDLVVRTYFQMKRQNHFELLGVPMGASDEDIERAFAARARLFHPDRLQRLPTSDLRDKGKEIYEAMTEAAAVLRDPARRERYLASLAPRPEPAHGLAAAEQEFRKGERLLQQGRWANAQVCFMHALRLNPKEPEYFLHLGWAMYQNYRNAGNETAVNRAVNFIRKALSMNPLDDRALYYLGRIYQEKGRIEVARQLFLRALRHNPGNEAAREALSSLGAGRGAG